MLPFEMTSIRPTEGFYTSELAAPQPMPVRTFLPVGYEPRYAYPLLVFFHGHGGNEEQILKLAPRLSRRNYVSIGLRGPVCVGQRGSTGALGYSWGGSSQLSLIEDYFLQAVKQMRRYYHIHSERVYLAGFAEGATLAYRLGLRFPDRLAGVVSLNGHLPRHEKPLLRLPEARSLQVFIGHGIANSIVPLTMAKQDHRLLYAAGLPLEMHTYPTNHRLHPDMLRDINRWIMARCNEE
jgi:phospholipase/carboxylesterase